MVEDSKGSKSTGSSTKHSAQASGSTSSVLPAAEVKSAETKLVASAMDSGAPAPRDASSAVVRGGVNVLTDRPREDDEPVAGRL